MFDTHITKIIKHPETITHHEHRAPTDESIRLAIELQDKTLQSIIDQRNIAENSFNAQITEYANHRDRKTQFIVSFVLNGKKESFSVDVPYGARPDMKTLNYIRQQIENRFTAYLPFNDLASILLKP